MALRDIVRQRARNWLEITPAEAMNDPVAVAEAEFAGRESFGYDYGVPDPLAYDNVGWQEAASEGAYRRDLQPVERERLVRRAQVYYARDSMGRQTVRLYTSYCIGAGMSIKARDINRFVTDDLEGDDLLAAQRGDDEETRRLQEDADAFWEHPDNSYVFSFEAQQELSDQLVVEGQVFLFLYPPDMEDEESDKITRVRACKDSLQFKRVVKNPEDESEPWYFLRVWKDKDGEEIRRLIPDYRLFLRDERDDEGNLRLPDKPRGPYLADAEVETRYFVRQVKHNTIGDWGISTLSTVMDWSKVNREYLEDRATLNRAWARIAWKRIVKGPASAVAAFGRRALSTVTGGGAGAGRAVPPASAGGTMTTNPGVDWENVNAQDGGKNAAAESRNFRLMGFMGAGFGEHYYGDGANGTRATSKSMERPVELLLKTHQMLWKKVWESIFAFHLAAKGREYDAHAVWVDAPQILEDDTATVINSSLAVMAVIPAFGVDEVMIRMLNALGIDDPQDVLPKIKQRERELYRQQLELAAMQAGLDLTAMGSQRVDPATGQADPAALSAENAALKKFISFITPEGSMTRLPGPKVGPQFAAGGIGATARLRTPTPAKIRPADTTAA